MDVDQQKSFIGECKVLAKKYSRSLNELKYLLDRVAKDEEHERIIKEASKNKDIVGRCFKKENPKHHGTFQYYKVLSEQSKNEYMVECLTFSDTPWYEFHTRLSMSYHAGDGFLGGFVFDSIRIDDVMAADIRKIEEVTEDEFRDAMRQYTEQLLNIKWKTKTLGLTRGLNGSK